MSFVSGGGAAATADYREPSAPAAVKILGICVKSYEIKGRVAFPPPRDPAGAKAARGPPA